MMLAGMAWLQYAMAMDGWVAVYAMGEHLTHAGGDEPNLFLRVVRGGGGGCRGFAWSARFARS